jgi:integrase
MHLGRVGEMKLKTARERCQEVRGRAKEGEDPRAGAPTRSDNFTAAVEKYIKDEQIGRCKNVPASANKTKSVMLSNCAAWASRPVATIRDSEIDALLLAIRDGDDEQRGRPYMAVRLHAHLRSFFAWCAKKKMLATSPMLSVDKPWDGEERRTRDWFKGTAADKAVVALWKAADKIGGNEGRYLKVLLLTGKRRSALAKMRWDQIEIDKDDWFWNAPLSLAKSKRLHSIPLPKKAQQVLKPPADSGAVFGTIKFDRLQYKIRTASGLDDFFFHGVRHLLESKLAELKIAPHIRDLLFDHVPQRGTGKTYDHYAYKSEMLDALNEWAAHIDGLLSPAPGVTRLR